MAYDRPNTTDYTHPQENNLLNVHKAMEYNSLGQPVIRTVGSGSNYSSAGNLDGSRDAFGKLRVSEPNTLFDSSFRYGDNQFNWNTYQTSGDAIVSHLPNESSISLYLGTTANEEIIRETKMVFQYQPGKSLLVMSTFVMAEAKANLRQRVGYFGANNGIYFEQSGTGYNIVRRSYTGGSVDNTAIAQANWNVDTLDGNGPSKVTADFSKSQIFWMDIEWLGVGSVRTGFVINGQFIICHIFHHANIADKVYMTTATLPVRYELTSTGAAGTMRAICSTVLSEGGYANRSQTRSIATPLTGRELSNVVYRPIICLRLKSANIDSVVVPTKFDLYGLQQAGFIYKIILNPTLTDANWTSAGTDSSVEYDMSATALTGGTTVDQGIFVGAPKGGSASVSSNEVDFSQQLGRTIAGVSDIWCLAAISTSNNDDVAAAVSWQEHG